MKLHWKRLSILIILGFGFVFQVFAQDTLTSISIYLSATDAESLTYKLVMGVHREATFCEDTLLGEKEAPPPNTMGFIFRWVNPIDPTNTDSCFGVGRGDLQDIPGVDYRPFYDVAQVDSYKISINAGAEGYPIKITWDDNVSELCDSLKMFYETFDGPVEVDMFTTYEHEFNAPESKIITIYKWGAKLVTGIHAEETVIPSEFRLYQNYPNPFNPSTSLRFSIPKSGYVSLKIFDIMGREVRELVSGELAPSNYTISWDGRNNQGYSVGSGVYYVLLKYQNSGDLSDNLSLMQKILLVK